MSGTMKDQRYLDTKIRHHLRVLERAGLIGVARKGKRGSAKYIHRKVDFFTHERLKSEPTNTELSAELPKTREELRVLGKD